MAEAPEKVFVVDDDEAVRKGLARLLRSAGLAVETFGSAADYTGREAYDAVGCVVLDVRMPGLDGMGLQALLAERDFDLPIIFLTGHGDIPMSVQAMKRGAFDFLTKPVDEEVLLTAVRQALSRSRADHRERLEAEALRARLGTLTPREHEVMQRVIMGALNKQIAAQLGIAEKTVKVHRGQVMRKLGVTTVAELIQTCQQAEIQPRSDPAT
jgi:FixJ family two-component response regulator